MRPGSLFDSPGLHRQLKQELEGFGDGRSPAPDGMINLGSPSLPTKVRVTNSDIYMSRIGVRSATSLRRLPLPRSRSLNSPRYIRTSKPISAFGTNNVSENVNENLARVSVLAFLDNKASLFGVYYASGRTLSLLAIHGIGTESQTWLRKMRPPPNQLADALPRAQYLLSRFHPFGRCLLPFVQSRR